MAQEEDSRAIPAHSEIHPVYEAEGPTFGDAFRFLWSHRLALFAHLLLLLILAAAGFLIWCTGRPRSAEATSVLGFHGIERGEYPSGKKFDIADFRAPDVLQGALTDAGISNRRIDAQTVAAGLDVVPVIPAEVAARWKKQDRDGTKREDFAPTAFRIRLPAKQLSNEEALRLLDAILRRFKERIKGEQQAALKFVSDWPRSNYATLLRDYDSWEIPYLLEQNVRLLNQHLTDLIAESREFKEFKDPKAGLSFRDLQKELALWTAMRLEPLKAMTVKSQLVRNKDLELATVKYRIEDLGIQIRQSSEETTEALKLLEVAQKPQPIMATPLGGKEGIPVVDTSIFDRLMRSDYLAPLVRHISELQAETKLLESRKARLENDMASLAKARNVSLEDLPSTYKQLTVTVWADLHRVIEGYNRVLDSYLNSSVTSLVKVEQGPRIVKDGASPKIVLIGLLFGATVGALFLVVLEASVHRALRLRAASSLL